MRPDGIVGQNHTCSVILDVRQSPAVLSRWQSQGVRLWLQPQIELCSWGWKVD